MHSAQHPLAWWAWAAALAVAATRLTGPLPLALVLAVVVTVVLARRGSEPWGRTFGAFLVLGACIVAVRVVFHVLVGIKAPGTVVWDLPRVQLPDWAVGVQLLGPVTTTGLATAATEGLRLAVLVICVGAANALTNPRRALRALPASLHHLGTAVVIAVSVTPQLAAAARTVRRAQRLRGDVPRGLAAVRATALPVLIDALDRSLALAASMDSRGYARGVRAGDDRRVDVLLMTALVATAVGVYGLLTSPLTIRTVAVLAVAVVAAVTASVLAGRSVRRTRYRPDRWGRRDWLVAGAGAFGAALIVGSTALTDAPDDVGLLAAIAGALAAAVPAVDLDTRATEAEVPA